jgi:hypothetical protein
MKYRLFLILLFFVFSTPLAANEKRELILEMLEITQAKKNHKLLIDTMVQQLANSEITSSENFEKYFREAMSWDNYIVPVAAIYEEMYTKEELEALLEFYSTEVGQSFLKKAPLISERVSQVAVQNAQNALKYLTEEDM